MRRAGHVARMEEKRNAYRVMVWKLEGSNNLENLSVDGRIILKLILKK
jgi:uncharacterized protein (UPF0128 family)